MARTIRKVTLEAAKYFLRCAISIYPFPGDRPAPLRTAEQRPDCRKNDGDNDEPRHDPPGKRTRTKPADETGFFLGIIRDKHQGGDRQCWNQHGKHLERDEDKRYNSNDYDEADERLFPAFFPETFAFDVDPKVWDHDQCNDCEGGGGHTAYHGREIMQQLLQSEKKTRRLRRV